MLWKFVSPLRGYSRSVETKEKYNQIHCYNLSHVALGIGLAISSSLLSFSSALSPKITTAQQQLTSQQRIICGAIEKALAFLQCEQLVAV